MAHFTLDIEKSLASIRTGHKRGFFGTSKHFMLKTPIHTKPMTQTSSLSAKNQRNNPKRKLISKKKHKIIRY